MSYEQELEQGWYYSDDGKVRLCLFCHFEKDSECICEKCTHNQTHFEVVEESGKLLGRLFCIACSAVIEESPVRFGDREVAI